MARLNKDTIKLPMSDGSTQEFQAVRKGQWVLVYESDHKYYSIVHVESGRRLSESAVCSKRDGLLLLDAVQAIPEFHTKEDWLKRVRQIWSPYISRLAGLSATGQLTQWRVMKERVGKWREGQSPSQELPF